MAITVAVWGEEKTGKTTLSLTFPKPIFHMDLDVGGFNRAAWRLDTKDIKTVSYPTPMQLEKMMGQTKEIVNGKATLRMPKKIIGMKELWTNIIIDYADAMSKPEYNTIVIDSGTALWNICHKAYLQELQEKQMAQGTPESDIRAQLQSIEYGIPNDRMEALLDTARTYRKNLVLTHYPRDVYAQRPTDHGIESYITGEKDIDGFKRTKQKVDIAIMTRQEKVNGEVKMATTITLSGLGITLVDQKFQDLTYDTLVKFIKMARGEAV
jgi:hypothetical protein